MFKLNGIITLGMDMRFEVFSDFDGISEQEWDGLSVRSNIDSPFLRYGYQRTWWEHKGGGEWLQAKLRILTAHSDGLLVGIAPLFIGEKNGEKEIHFIGSIEISDYLDFIVPVEYTSSFIKGVFQFIQANKKDFPGFLQLFNIPDNSPTLPELKEIGNGEAWKVEIESAYHTPAIKLAADWEVYLAGISKKQRHEIRRKLRRASGAEDDVGWHISGNTDDLDQDIADFVHLMEYDEDKRRFLTEEMRAQIEAIIHWAADNGYLQLSFLTVNSEKAAGYLCFDYADRIWVYNSGFRPDFQYYSPGWVLLSYLIQHAIENGKTHFDFMRGNETYKYRFGAEDSFVMKAKVELRTP